MKNPVAQKANWTNSPAITCQHSILDNLTTDEFAMAIREKPASLRSELCRTGSVKGVKPIKLTSNKGGRLLWPRRDVEALLLKLGATQPPSPDKAGGGNDHTSIISFSCEKIEKNGQPNDVAHLLNGEEK